MNECSTAETKMYSSCASLAALGVKLNEIKLFEPIRQKVQIAQKIVKDRPIDKLDDGWIAMLAGAHGLIEINTRLRAEPGLQAAKRTLGLDEAKRRRTIVRVDVGGGSVDDINWLLARGYQVIIKDYSTARASRLAQQVTWWADDPKVAGRQVGWVPTAAPEYVRSVRRMAVRCRKANGQWGIGVLISTLAPAEVLALIHPEAGPNSTPQGVLLAYVNLYDQRGRGVETSFKGDKQGLGLTKRSKKRFAAQQMVMLLATLAHNVIVWAHRWLAAPKLAQYGILRMVRDVFHLSGFLVRDASGSLTQITLNQAAPLTLALYEPLGRLLASAHVAVTLDKT